MDAQNNNMIITPDGEVLAPAEMAETSAVQAIINGDYKSNFDIIAQHGDFTAVEAYSVTRPDTEDEDTISIGKAAKNVIIEIDRWIIYRFVKDGQPAVGIVIFGKNKKKYVTSSAYFIREFMTLNMLAIKDGMSLDKVKVIHKQSKTGNTYPLCTFA